MEKGLQATRSREQVEWDPPGDANQPVSDVNGMDLRLEYIIGPKWR